MPRGPKRFPPGPLLLTLASLAVAIASSSSPICFIAPSSRHCSRAGFRRGRLLSRSRREKGDLVVVGDAPPGSRDDQGKKEKKGGGYQFGDISRSLARRFTSSVKDLTGKEEYEVGDLSRWVDARVKDRVNVVTGKDNYTFGDLSRWADTRAKDKAMEFTNKTDYHVGDVTKEILRRVRSGEYQTEDILLLCKILVALGAGLSPVASSLPGRLLVEMLDVSLAQELGGRLVGAITLELDRRMKQAVTGDASYELGDLTKKAFLKFIDKDEYKFGDITKTVLQRMEDTETAPGEVDNKPKTFAESARSTEAKKVPGDEQQESVDVLDLDPKILEELLEWDKALIEQEMKEKK